MGLTYDLSVSMIFTVRVSSCAVCFRLEFTPELGSIQVSVIAATFRSRGGVSKSLSHRGLRSHWNTAHPVRRQSCRGQRAEVILNRSHLVVRLSDLLQHLCLVKAGW